MRVHVRAALVAALTSLHVVSAVAQPSPATAARDERGARAAVDRMFEGMRTADSAMVRSVFAPGARFALIDARSTPPAVRFESVDGWITAIAGSNRAWDEQIYDVQVRVDGNMAQVWAPYSFYVNKQLRHCGVDSFELLHDGQEWKVTQVSDTRRRENCPDPLAR